MRIKQNRTAKRPYRRVVAALLLAILIGMAGLTARAGKAQSRRFPLESAAGVCPMRMVGGGTPSPGRRRFTVGSTLPAGRGHPFLR